MHILYSTHMFRLTLNCAIIWTEAYLYIISAVVSDQYLNYSDYKNKEQSLKKAPNVSLL
jgi:hypothetical protein